LVTEYERVYSVIPYMSTASDKTILDLGT
jgi:hypothetical protein